MHNYDVVFLLLSQCSSPRFERFVKLYDEVALAGFHTSIATHPSHLEGGLKRLRLVVIDGDSKNRDFEVYHVTRMVRAQSLHQGIVLLGASGQQVSTAGLREGADVCLSGDIDSAELCRTLYRLAHRYNAYESMLEHGSSEKVRWLNEGQERLSIGGQPLEEGAKVGGAPYRDSALRRRVNRKMSKRMHSLKSVG